MANVKGERIYEVGSAELGFEGNVQAIPCVTELYFEPDGEEKVFSASSLEEFEFRWYPYQHFRPKHLPQTIVIERNRK